MLLLLQLIRKRRRKKTTIVAAVDDAVGANAADYRQIVGVVVDSLLLVARDSEDVGYGGCEGGDGDGGGLSLRVGNKTRKWVRYSRRLVCWLHRCGWYCRLCFLGHRLAHCPIREASCFLCRRSPSLLAFFPSNS